MSVSSRQALGVAGSPISPRSIGVASYCCLHAAEADHGRDGEGMSRRRNIFYTATASGLRAASHSRVFPRSLHFPISAGDEVPVWPPAAGRLSRGGGRRKGLPRPSWSFSDPDIKHDAVLAMHFVLLLCKPRVYKPTGRSASSSSRHRQPCFRPQAPLSCRGVFAAFSSLLSY